MDKRIFPAIKLGVTNSPKGERSKRFQRSAGPDDDVGGHGQHLHQQSNRSHQRADH